MKELSFFQQVVISGMTQRVQELADVHDVVEECVWVVQQQIDQGPILIYQDMWESA
jgi:hypothetical protein